jgi:hypothetical protein
MIAPANPSLVQQKVRAAGGYVSQRPHGDGVARGLEYLLERFQPGIPAAR